MANSTANMAITLMCLATGLFMYSRIAPDHYAKTFQEPMAQQWQKLNQQSQYPSP